MHGAGWNAPAPATWSARMRGGRRRGGNHPGGCDRGRADGQHAGHPRPDRRHGRGALEEDPAGHALPDQQAAGPRARVHRAPREHGRHHADDGLHPVRRLRVGLPLDGDRPAVHRPGRAGQGLPLRRRPARRRARRAAQGPLRGRARDLRLHPLLQLHRRLPQGGGADEPDHAAAPPGGRRLRDQRPQQRPPPRGVLRHPGARLRPAARGRAASAQLRRQLVVWQVPPGGRGGAAQVAAARSSPRCCKGKVNIKTAMLGHKIAKPDLDAVKRMFKKVDEPPGAGRAQPVCEWLRGRSRARRRPRSARQERNPSPPRAKARRHEGRLLAGLREPRVHAGVARVDGQGRAAARPRAHRARPRRLLRRRRHRRAQPGAGRHAQRAHLRAGPADRRRADDEHLLHLPGRAVRVPGAAGRQHRLPRPHQREPRR